MLTKITAIAMKRRIDTPQGKLTPDFQPAPAAPALIEEVSAAEKPYQNK